MPNKINFFFLFFSLLLFLMPVIADSARPLEVEYPPVPGIPQPPASVETDISVYLKYIFNFSLWIAGFIALGALFYGGFRYMTSSGNAAALADAKNQIFAALAGLLILMSSWLILTSINPQLTHPQINNPPSALASVFPGTYLCLETTDEVGWAWLLMQEIKTMPPFAPEREAKVQQLNEYLKIIDENCWRVPTKGEIASKVNDLAKLAYVVPSETGQLYGALLYDESGFGGKVQVVYIIQPTVKKFEITAIKPSSIKPFTLNQPRPEAHVEVYRLINFNRENPAEKSKLYEIDDIATGYFNIAEDFPYGNSSKIGSVKVEGDLIAIFFKDKQSGNWPPDAVLDIVLNTDATLYDNAMGRWNWEVCWQVYCYYPSPKQMVIVSGGIY